MSDSTDEQERTVFCGNLSQEVTEPLLYELFLQAGPVEKVNIVKGPDNKPKSFGFVTFVHAISVPYSVELFTDVMLFKRSITINPRTGRNTGQVMPSNMLPRGPISSSTPEQNAWQNATSLRGEFNRHNMQTGSQVSYAQFPAVPVPTTQLDPQILMMLGSQMFMTGNNQTPNDMDRNSYGDYNDDEGGGKNRSSRYRSHNQNNQYSRHRKRSRTRSPEHRRSNRDGYSRWNRR